MSVSSDALAVLFLDFSLDRERCFVDQFQSSCDVIDLGHRQGIRAFQPCFQYVPDVAAGSVDDACLLGQVRRTH